MSKLTEIECEAQVRDSYWELLRRVDDLTFYYMNEHIVDIRDSGALASDILQQLNVSSCHYMDFVILLEDIFTVESITKWLYKRGIRA